MRPAMHYGILAGLWPELPRLVASRLAKQGYSFQDEEVFGCSEEKTYSHIYLHECKQHLDLTDSVDLLTGFLQVK